MRTPTRNEAAEAPTYPASLGDPESEGAVGDELLFEAPTVEEALEDVAAELGSDARILGADKVRRGGVLGFFAHEVVQVRACPSTPADPVEPAEHGSAPRGVDGVLAELSRRHGAQERSFADALRRQLQPEPSPPAGSPRSPALTSAWQPDGGQPAGDDSATWSLRNLQRLELPALVVDAVRTLSPDDEPAWVYAVARAVEPLCRPLPDGPSMLVGTRAHRLGTALDLEVVQCGGRPPARASVAAQLTDAPDARAWLAAAREGRWLHLVVGGDGWQGLLFDRPQAVSWVGAEAVCRAVRLAAELELALGYGLVDTGPGARLVAATPFEVAVAIRTQLLRLTGERQPLTPATAPGGERA